LKTAVILENNPDYPSGRSEPALLTFCSRCPRSWPQKNTAILPDRYKYVFFTPNFT
jgi:hypothetical protein